MLISSGQRIIDRWRNPSDRISEVQKTSRFFFFTARNDQAFVHAVKLNKETLPDRLSQFLLKGYMIIGGV